MAQHQGGVRYLGQLEPMWIFSVWNLLYKKQEFILYTCIAFDTNASPGHLNIVSDFQFTRPDSLIFRASSEIVEHRFAFFPNTVRVCLTIGAHLIRIPYTGINNDE